MTVSGFPSAANREVATHHVRASFRTIALLALVLAAASACAGAWLTPAAGAVSPATADRAALRALGSAEGSAPVIVFRQLRPLAPGTVVAQAGAARASASSAFAPDTAVRRDRLRRAGATVTRAPSVMRVGGEPSWLYYEDRGPFELYEHPGRVALVGVRSGRAHVSESFDWPPLVAGRLPLYLRNATGYRDGRYRVFTRVPSAGAARASTRAARGAAARAGASAAAITASVARDALGRRGPLALTAAAGSDRAAAALAREHACGVTVADMLGNAYDYASVDRSRAAFGSLLADLERRDRGFVAARYSTRDGLSPSAFVTRLIAGHSCRSVLLFVAGGGVRGGQPTISLGASGHAGGRLDQQDLRVDELRALLRAHPRVDWQLLVDAPYAGGLIAALKDEPNLRVLITASDADEPTYACIPGVARLCPQTPTQLAFTSRILSGIDALLGDLGAVDRASAVAAAGGAPFLGSLLTEGYARGTASATLRQLGVHPQSYVNFPGAPAPAPGLGGAPGPTPQSIPLPPFAQAQRVSTDEDTAVRIDLASDPIQALIGSFSIVGGPAHGRLSGSGRFVTYTPDPDYNGPDAFDFRVTVAFVVSTTATVSITVRAVADAPVVTTSAGTTSYTERAPPVSTDPAVTVRDADSPNLTRASVRIAAGYASGQDVLAFRDTGAIRGRWDPATGLLTLTGSAPVADYQAALRSITYENTSSDPVGGPRQVAFTANDGSLTSAAATRPLDVRAIADPPVLTVAGGAVAYTENDPATTIDGSATVSDADSANLSGATAQLVRGLSSGEDVLELTAPAPAGITARYDGASGTLTLSGTASLADYEAALRTVAYRNTRDAPSTATRGVEFVATDAGGTRSIPVARDVTLAAIPDAPVADDDAYTTDAGTRLTVAAPGALTNDGDADGDPLTIGEVEGSAANVGSALATPRGATVTVAADGSLSYDPAGAFDGLRAGDEVRETITYRVTDGALTDTATITFTVTGVNDAPEAVDDDYRSSDSAPLTVAAPGVIANDADVDGDALTVTEVDGSGANLGTAYRTARGALVTVNADGSLRYDPNGAFTDVRDGDEVSDSVTYRVSDGNGGSDTATLTVTVTGGNDRPDAVDDAYSTAEDTTVTDAAPGVLVNDSDLDGDVLSVDQVDGSAANVGRAFRTARGATVTVGADGSLRYDPTGVFDALRPGEQATDSVTYRATDGSLADTATIRFTIDGVNDAPVALDDRYAGVGNTTLVVSDPAPTGEAAKQLTGSVQDNDRDPDDLDAAISVRAQTVGSRLGGRATIDSDGSFTYTPPTGTTGTDDSFDYAVTDGTDSDTGTVTIRLTSRVWYVDNTEAAGGTGRSSDAFDTLAEATAASGSGDTIFVHTGSGTTGQNGGAVLDANERLIGEADDLVVGGDMLYDGATARRPSIGNAAGAGVTLASGSTVRGLSIGTAGGAAITGRAGTAASTIDDVRLTGSAGGLALSGTSGAFDVSDATIDTTGGTGLSASGAGTLNLTSAGTITVRSSGGRGVDVASTALSGTLDSVVVTGSSAGGVALQSTTGAIAFGDVSVAATGGTGFLADTVAGLSLPAAGTANVSDSGGTAVAIRNDTAPNVTFDTVSATGAGSTGIDVSGNRGGGTTTFSGTTTTSTTTATGISLANNSGHAIAFSGGSLGITTTSGRGFDATGGGTVTVTGSGNRVASGTGTPLRIQSTTIGAADATFQSVTANGAANGIVLDTTGSSGNLAVTGTGTAGSGGTIQNIRGADGTTQGIGVYLNSTSGPALRSLTLTDNEGWAVRGVDVAGFSIDASTINGVNGTNDALDEGGVSFSDPTGTSAITSTAVSGAIEDNVSVNATRGALDLTLDGDDIGANSATLGGNGVLIANRNTVSARTTVTDTQFRASREDLFQHLTTDTARSDVTFSGNTLANGQASQLSGSTGALIQSGGNGSGADLTYRIQNNRVSGIDGSAIFVQKGTGIATTRGRIEDNQVGQAGVALSGARSGSGIVVESRGQGTHVARVSGNTVRQYLQDGISTVNGEDGAADNGVVNVQLTVVNNTVTEAGIARTLTGLRNEQADPNATIDECLDVSGNVVTGAGPFGSDIRVLFDFPQNTIRLPGYSGGSADTAAVQAYLDGRNTSSRTVATHPGSGPGYVNGGSGCTQPPA